MFEPVRFPFVGGALAVKQKGGGHDCFAVAAIWLRSWPPVATIVGRIARELSIIYG